jgi:hypothetical protein
MNCACVAMPLVEVAVSTDALTRRHVSCAGERVSLRVKVDACAHIVSAKRSLRQAIGALLECTKTRKKGLLHTHVRFPSAWGGFGYNPVHSIIALTSAASLTACAPVQPTPAEIHAADMIRRGYVEWAVRCAWADGHEGRPLASALRRCEMDLGLRQCAHTGGACQRD